VTGIGYLYSSAAARGTLGQGYGDNNDNGNGPGAERELQTAYTGHLGDLALGTLGALLAGLIVGQQKPASLSTSNI
jgi:hypothetical protein